MFTCYVNGGDYRYPPRPTLQKNKGDKMHECESLKSIIRRGYLKRIDGKVWLPKARAEDGSEFVMIQLNYCLFCGNKI